MIRFTTMMLAAFAVIATCAMAQGGTTPAQDTTTPQPKDYAATPIPMESTSTSGDKPNDGSSFGIKLMYGVGMLSYDPAPANTTIESSPAYSAGLFWNHSGEGVISFGLQTELLYVSESGLLRMGAQGSESEQTVTTTSIRLPILLKLQFLDRNLIQPSVYVGPSIGYQLTATTEVGEASTDIDRANGFQYGLAVGVDATFLRIFVVDIRYNMNFSDIASADEVELTPDTAITMSSLRFGLGLRF